MDTSNTGKAKFYRAVWLKIIWFTYFWIKKGKNRNCRLWVHETPILEIISVTLTKNSPVITNDTQRRREYPHHQKYLKGNTLMRNMALKLTWYFYLLISSDSLLSRDTVQPGNIYYCILEVTGQIWESQRRIRININRS